MGRHIHHALKLIDLSLLHVNQGLLVLPDSFGGLMHAFELADFLLLLQEALLVVIPLFAHLFKLGLDAIKFFLVLSFLVLKLVGKLATLTTEFRVNLWSRRSTDVFSPLIVALLMLDSVCHWHVRGCPEIFRRLMAESR